MEKQMRWSIFIKLLVLVFMLSACNLDITKLVSNAKEVDQRQRESDTATSQVQRMPQVAWGQRTKKSGCQAQGPLPDKRCTPGDIFIKTTAAAICVPGYASDVRNVSVSTKNKVYASYGIVKRKPGQYQIDHLVNLGIGGSNDISNLWPEAAAPKPGFHEKDRLENYLRDQVCSQKMSLLTAQTLMATDWVAAYQAMPKNYSNNSQDAD
jgi:hypothetical protein